MAPDDARREALRQFGDLEATRNYCRQQDEERENVMQRALLFQDFMQDLRIGVRSLLRAPVLTLTIIVTVGLGLGATAAIFSAVNAALLRPLPYAEPENLVRIYTDTPPFKFRFSAVDYLAFTEQQTTLRTARHLHRSRGQLHQWRHRRTAAHARGVVGVLLGARHAADDRPRFHRTGRQARQPASGDRQPRVLAAAARRPVRTRSASRSGSTAPTYTLVGVHAAGGRSARSALRPVPHSTVHAAARAKARSSTR